MDNIQKARIENERKLKSDYKHSRFTKAISVAKIRRKRAASYAKDHDMDIADEREEITLEAGSVAPGSTILNEDNQEYQLELGISPKAEYPGKLFKSAFYLTQAELLKTDRSIKAFVKPQYKPDFSIKKRPHKLPPIEKLVTDEMKEIELTKSTDFSMVDAMKDKYLGLIHETRHIESVVDVFQLFSNLSGT